MVLCQVVHCPRTVWSSPSSACQIHTALVPTHAAGHEAVLIGLASYLKDLQWFIQLLLHGMQTLPVPSEMSPKIPGDNSQNNSAGIK